jgi:hypothetical protein
MDHAERELIRSQIVMSLESATSYVRRDVGLHLAELDIHAAGVLLSEIVDNDAETAAKAARA